MKKDKFILILLLSSALLFIPSVKPDYEVELVPNQVQTTIVKIDSPQVVISSKVQSIIQVNISYYNFNTNESELIVKDTFTTSDEFNLENSGYYKFDFLSQNLGVVTINETGMSTISIAIFLFFLGLYLFVFINKIIQPY